MSTVWFCANRVFIAMLLGGEKGFPGVIQGHVARLAT
jgi:hypothetical protein